MTINETAAQIIESSFKIHRALDPGLLESVYQRILAYELRKAKLQVETQVPIPVTWDNHKIDESFKADIIVNNQVLIELKSLEHTTPVHKKQTLTYIKLANLQLGLLINFGATLLKEDIHRLANNLKE